MRSRSEVALCPQSGHAGFIESITALRDQADETGGKVGQILET